ncbi:hypothetical protein Trydic_g99 [Trypoxylus dichotomus]
MIGALCTQQLIGGVFGYRRRSRTTRETVAMHTSYASDAHEQPVRRFRSTANAPPKSRTCDVDGIESGGCRLGGRRVMRVNGFSLGNG